jgi:hypothetical protein
MSTAQYRSSDDTNVDTRLNGAAAAAILAAGIGCGALGVLAFSADASGAFGRLLNIYNPTGTLSGVSTGAIIVWLVAWLALHRLWRMRTIALGKINAAAFALLAVGFLLTFPPVMDLLQGR